MRNLKLIDTQVVKELPDLFDALFLSVDTDLGTVYAATKASIFAFSPSTKQILASVLLKNGENRIDCTPVGLQYLCDQQAVCVALRNGQLCLWDTNSSELECVGEVEQGLITMCWSPDLELFVITTGSNTMIMMTREFDAVTEVSLFPEDVGEANPVTVGWGKKETQFHGSAGKEAAKAQAQDINPVDLQDHQEACACWRGDGQFFVVSAVDPVTKARFLYTWSRECVFQSRSEIVDGLQHCLSWKPSGSIIASVQKNRNMKRLDVVFFEKNGLRHGEFSIPLNQKPVDEILVRCLMWNQDSSVLALCIDEQSPNEKQQSSQLQLWTVNNYHWYLKQSLRFECGISTCGWDSEHLYKMHVITKAGCYISYSWYWTTCQTSGSSASDVASVAVIDGAQVLVTPMRLMVVPPPMAAFTLTIPSPANIVTCDPTPGSNALAVLMADSQLAIFDYQDSDTKTNAVFDAAGGGGFNPMCDLPTCTNILRIQGYEVNGYPLDISHFLWLSKLQFIFTTLDQYGEASIVHVGDMKQDEKTVVVQESLPVESHVIGMSINEVTGNVAIQLSSGELLKYSQGSVCPWEAESGQEVAFPYPCCEMAVTVLGNEEIVLGLTERFRFYINNTEVVSNCTSFGLHNDFLLLTTLTHTIRCISRTTKIADLPKLSDDKLHMSDENIRRIERGSRIVVVVGDDTKVVLQMPRGNLETIHPRALVLNTIKHQIDRDRIHDAFLIMRKHRINMNLLHDHNPEHFIANVDEVIAQIHSVNHINLFLTDLIEEDVTRTMYSSFYPELLGSRTGNQHCPGSKVDWICDAFLAAFKRLDKKKYLLPILTAHVRKTKPELEDALLLVWSLHGENTGDVISAEDALKYMLFLVDVNTLYDVALGTYNFDLVMMVAAKSQKDPKEYIPFLNQLRQMEENYRYYTIDKHLKHYSRALEHISKCGDEHFEELVNLVSEQKLHSKSLRFYNPGSKQYKNLATLYGKYLRSKNRHDEAGIMFVKAEEWELALEAFRASNDWCQAFCMASRLGYSSSQLTELAVKIAGDLKSRQMYSDAATVYEQYAQDVEEAIVALIEGAQWNQALRLMHHYRRLDLIETHLKEALEESYDHHMEVLTTQRGLFDHHKKRLFVVRANKERAKTDMMDGLGDYNDADADLFSDATSMTGASITSASSAHSSRSTVFSKTKSSRTQRKAENKKWSLKEGSANEEFALVDAVSKIVKSVDSMKEETCNLLKILIQFNYDEKASKLQEYFSDFLSEIQSSLTEIWIYNSADITNTNLGPNTTANSIAQAVQSGRRPQQTEGALEPTLLVPPSLNKDNRWKLHIAGASDR